MRRHNKFLTFLKKVLLLFALSNPNWRGVKILIAGRFNLRRRSRQRTVQVGQVPLQEIDALMDYATSEAYTRSGTLGVKVWICAKPVSGRFGASQSIAT